MYAMSTMTTTEREHLKSKIAAVLSEILTDKYGDEYGVEIKLRFEPKDASHAGTGAA